MILYSQQHVPACRLTRLLIDRQLTEPPGTSEHPFQSLQLIATVPTLLDVRADGGPIGPLEEILPHLDVYVPSHAEAAHQTGRTDPRAILEVYRECGAEGLVGVKLGAEGALLSPDPGTYVEIEAVPPPGPVVDTTGAGDCFYAGLVTGLLQGMHVDEAGRLAAACGAMCVTGKGATTAVGDYAETARLAGLAR